MITPTRSHEISQPIARKELDKAGFEIASKLAAWEHFMANANTLVVVTNMPLPPGKTYIHVIATSNTDAPAKEWAAAIIKGDQGEQDGTDRLIALKREADREPGNAEIRGANGLRFA